MKNKKIKFLKKRNKRRRKFKNINIYLILICLTLLISIIIIIIIFFLKKIQNYNPEKISYKGKKIERNKLITDYLTYVSNDEKTIAQEKRRAYRFFSLPEYSTSNSTLQKEIKNKFMQMFSKIKNKPLNKIDTFFLSYACPFGNSVILINNLIFTCEIVGCKKIILKDHHTNRKWLIKNQVYMEQIKITIMQGPNVDCGDDTIFCVDLPQWDPFKPIIVKPEVRIQYLKNEVIQNLPKVNTNPDDLYIHLRGGDIFGGNPSDAYAQPPFCFYEKIIDNNKFKNVYIISMDKKNIVLNKLMNKYKYIFFQKNNYEHDISLLIHAYKIVTSVSSFVISAIKFNDNLEDLWEYDINRLSEKFYILHHHTHKFYIKYKIHTMKPSEIYAHIMFKWRKSSSQLKLMLEEKCPYDFEITKSNM